MENTQSMLKVPESGHVINEKMYPISYLWVFKWAIILIAASIVLIFFRLYISYIVIIIPASIILKLIERARFHYALKDEGVWVKKGGVIDSMKEETLLYSEIQYTYVDKDLYDRIFGLGNLVVEKIIPGGAVGQKANSQNFLTLLTSKYTPASSTPANKNTITISGLTAKHAEILRDIIVKKMELHKNTNQAPI